MHLRRLRIDSMPGLEPGFTFQAPSQGVNVVTGPNAVGKSSLVRALGYLLRDPQRDDPPALSLAAEFSSAKTSWTVRRGGSQVVWERDGETVTAPSLPGSDQIGLYRLSVESLLAGDRTDTELAAELQRSLRGGFDLDEPRARTRTRIGSSAGKAVLAARKALADVESKYEHLRRQEGELPALARQIRKAESAGKELNRLHAAKRLYEAAAERKARERKLAGFSEALGNLKGDEVGRADGLEARVGKLKRELQAEQRSLKAAIEEHRRTGLADSRPGWEEVEAIDKCLQRMSVDRATEATRRAALAKAERALQQAITEFDGPGRAPMLDRDSLGRCEAIAGPLIAARAELKELEQRIAICGDPPQESEIERLQRAAGALRSWLADAGRHESSSPAANRGLQFALWVALGAGLFAAGLSYPEEMIAAIAAVAAAIASGGALLMAFRRARGGPAAGEAARREFEETGLAPPDSWSAGGVREHLHGEVESRLNAMLLQRERAGSVKQLRVQLEETAAEVNKLEAKRKALAEEVGFDPTLPLSSLDRFLRLCMRLDDARGQRDACRTDLDLIEKDIVSAAVRVGEFLNCWRLQDAAPIAEDGAAPDGDLLQATFDSLKQRLTDADSAIGGIKSGEAGIKALRQQMEDAQDDLQSLFGGAGLQRGDRDSLQRLVGHLEDWRKASKALEQARGHENQLRAEISQAPELVRLVDRDEKQKLATCLEAAETGASKYAELRDRRKAIETRLDEAGAESRLEQAVALLGREREALAEKLDQALQHAANELLLDDVEQAFKTQQEPQVLRRAGELFAEATAHAFALVLDDDEFKARDQQSGGLKPLEHLSSGTRMQLLLALRLAWTEAQEQGGEMLPLFLDEALTTSDENRFGVMANSLEKLAEAGGRQIFYLTARRQEAKLWHDLTGTRPPTVDLAELRFGEGAGAAEDYRVELPPSRPAPEGKSAEDYAALLGVPTIQPLLPAGNVHPFHLLRDDLDLLYSLMDRWHIGSAGQLEHLLRSSAAAGAVTDAAMRARLETRCRALHAWLDFWRQGRGRPVDRGVLESSGAVSTTFIDRAAALADDLEGDGKALIDALNGGHLKGFRSGKIEELEDWMVAEGYIDERLTPSAEDRRRLTLQQLAPESEAAASEINEVVTWLEAAATWAA